MKRVGVLVLILVGLVGLLACGQVPEQAQPDSVPGEAPLPQAPLLPPLQGETLVQEDFSAGTQADWAVLDTAQTPGEQAYWYVSDGVLVQGGTTMERDSVDPAYFVVGGSDWSDYTVRAALYVETNNEVGLIFRVNDQGFYRFRIRSAVFDGPFNMGLDRYQADRYEVLWHDFGQGFPLEQWFTLQIEVRGNTFTVLMDGQVVAVVQDPTFPTGGVGLYAWSEGGAYFDNVTVTR